jgi:uncharacterized repeat protein (TIGR01451 family)
MTRRRRLHLVLFVAMLLLAGFPMLAPRPVAAAGTADLAVTMVGDRKHVKFLDTITFTITVSNLGPDVATGVTLGIGVSDSYGDLGATCPDGTVSTFCDLGSIESGKSVTVLFHAIASNDCCPNRLGVAVASVTHDTDTVDPVSANDAVTVETRFTGKAPF